MGRFLCASVECHMNIAQCKCDVNIFKDRRKITEQKDPAGIVKCLDGFFPICKSHSCSVILRRSLKIFTSHSHCTKAFG